MFKTERLQSETEFKIGNLIPKMDDPLAQPTGKNKRFLASCRNASKVNGEITCSVAN